MYKKKKKKTVARMTMRARRNRTSRCTTPHTISCSINNRNALFHNIRQRSDKIMTCKATLSTSKQRQSGARCNQIGKLARAVNGNSRATRPIVERHPQCSIQQQNRNIPVPPSPTRTNLNCGGADYERRAISVRSRKSKTKNKFASARDGGGRHTIHQRITYHYLYR
jgi:hypothetical protein